MSIRHIIRDVGLRIAPGPMLELMSWRSQRLIIRQEREDGRLDASRDFINKQGPVVSAGPFKGMRYPQTTIDERNLIPKILASYEAELHPWIERLCAARYSMMVNVGSADGYYTVGLALRKPDTLMLGFDTDFWARQATRALARENAVDNVNVHGMCTPRWLATNLKPGALILSDCEGYEATLLNPQEAPVLRQGDILVELHEHVVPGVQAAIRERFESSHDIDVVAAREKDPDDYPEIGDVISNMRAKVISEGRNRVQHWLFMTARKRRYP